MLRRFLLPLLGLAFFATEAASAQTAPAAPAAAKPVAGGYAHPAARPRALTARERRAAEVAAAAAKAEAAKAAVAVASAQTPAAATSWSGWGDETVSSAQDVGNGQHRPTTNLSVAPGMPINQVGHGVTTDYHGRSLRPEVASTTLPAAR